MGKTIQLSVFIILSLVFSGYSQTAEKYYELAKQVYPNYEKATYFLTKAIFKDPKNADYYLTRAKVHIMSGGNKRSDINRDLEKARTFAPTNPYVYCWIAYYNNLGHGEKFLTKNKEIYTCGKNIPKVLSYYILQATEFKESVQFDDSQEISTILKKSPKTYRNLVTHITFLEAEGRQKEADELFNDLKTLSYTELSQDLFANQEIEKDGIPLVQPRMSHFFTSSYKLSRSKNYALMVRQLEEEFEIFKFQKLPFLRHMQNLYPAPTVSSYHIQALLKVGKYQDSIKYARNLSSELAEMKVLWASDAYKYMGLYKEAANLLETSIKNDSYIFESTYDYFKYLIYDQEFSKALKLAKTLNFKKESPINQKSLLLCTYYIATNQYDLWEKSFKTIKKFHRRSNYREIMNQANLARISSKNPHYNIYDLIKNDETELLLEILFTQSNSALSKKNLEEAKKWLDEAKKIDPDDCRHIFQEANLLFKTGETDNALSTVNTFLKQAPNNQNGIILKGMIELELLKFKEAYDTFGKILNKKTSSYYRLIPLFCLGKYKYVEKAADDILANDPDLRSVLLLHMITEQKSKDNADSLFKKYQNLFQTAISMNYSQYKLGKITFEEYKTRQDFGPLFGPKFNFTIGFEAMQKGEKDKAVEHFKKCLIPYSIDLPEYHMAKACLKALEK
ncbi:MAG: hypothetical protein NE327_18670 [Lentisphaeraceae bacterium]|nr:hypothetical protein [Lentisphaeraceae bacterium]